MRPTRRGGNDGAEVIIDAASIISFSQLRQLHGLLLPVVSKRPMTYLSNVDKEDYASVSTHMYFLFFFK